MEGTLNLLPKEDTKFLLKFDYSLFFSSKRQPQIFNKMEDNLNYEAKLKFILAPAWTELGAAQP